MSISQSKSKMSASLAFVVALVGCMFTCGLSTNSVMGQENFADLVGFTTAEPMKPKEAIEVPFLTWGGDAATFHANGAAKTLPDSIYGELGLNLELVNGDDFVTQVKRYLKGETPFLRGTVRMIGIAAEAIAETEPVMFLQLTWSAGDHMVSRKTVGTLNELKGKKIALQSDGPHVGMLADILDAARLDWDDIEVVWCKDLTGTADSPASKFKEDASIDAVLCISPDMVTLTGGLDSKGTGASGSVKDARVLVSTAQMSRSIADVYVCRKDFFEENRNEVEKFVQGYLKASESVLNLKTEFEQTGDNPEYLSILKLTQKMLGEDVLPTLEADVHGLISDCSFVGLPGNVSFFTDSGNLSGFDAKVKSALNLATGQGYAKKRGKIEKCDFDWEKIKAGGSLESEVEQKAAPRFAELGPDDLFPDDPVVADKKKDDIILSFTINFKPNQEDFPHDEYGEDFKRALEAASTFGKSVIAVGGHGDPTKMLREAIVSGMKSNKVTRSGEPGDFSYSIEGKALDLEDTASIIKQVREGVFGATTGEDGEIVDPKLTLQALLELSEERAESVKKALAEYAENAQINLDQSQIKPVGVGPREPLVPKPTNRDEALQNMRVEFRLMKVKAEDVASEGFDF